MKRKIVLFEPIAGILSENYRVIPLSLLAISRFINFKKYDVFIIDQKIDGWENKLKFILNNRSVFLFGITALTGYQLYFATLIAKYVKYKRPDIKIVFGGSHATALPEQLLKEDFVDFVIIGEGELPFPKLVENIHDYERLKKIKGIGFKKDGKIIINPPEFMDYSNLINPPYEIININDYKYVEENKEFYIEGAKGCIFRCTFCYNNVFYRGKWRARSAEKIVENIEFVYNKYKIKRFFIIDDSFLIDLNRVKRFLELINEKNLKIEWSIEANLIHLSLLSDEFLKKMYDAGLRWISVGVESGSEKVRRFFRKPVSEKSLLEFNKRISKYDIKVRYNFMIGTPIENIQDIRATIELIKKLIKNKNAMIQPLYITTPFPKTEYETQIKKFGYIVPRSTKEWFDYDPFTIRKKLPWLKGIKGSLAEFLMYESFFIDRKMEFYFSSKILYHKFMRALIKIYRLLAKFRFFNLLFFFFPEKYLFSLIFYIEKKRILSNIKRILK